MPAKHLHSEVHIYVACTQFYILLNHQYNHILGILSSRRSELHCLANYVPVLACIAELERHRSKPICSDDGSKNLKKQRRFQIIKFHHNQSHLTD